MEFVIVVHGYYINAVNEKITTQSSDGVSETKIVKKSPGDYIGGIAVYCDLPDLEAAKNRAKETWKENFIGNIRQLMIKDEKGHTIFKSDNFNLLR